MGDLLVLQSLFPNLDIDVISVIYQATGYNLDLTVDSLLEIGQDGSVRALPDDFLRPPSYFRQRSVAGEYHTNPIPKKNSQKNRTRIPGLVKGINKFTANSAVTERLVILRQALKRRFDRIRSKFNKISDFTETESLLSSRCEDEIRNSSDSDSDKTLH